MAEMIPSANHLKFYNWEGEGKKRRELPQNKI